MFRRFPEGNEHEKVVKRFGIKYCWPCPSEDPSLTTYFCSWARWDGGMGLIRCVVVIVVVVVVVVVDVPFDNSSIL